MRYFVRFVGDIIPALRLGVNLPPQVAEFCFADVNTEEELVNFVNEYSLMLLQRGGLVVLKEENIPPRSAEERATSPMPRPKTPVIAFDRKMIVPMHMISHIHPEVMFVPPQPASKPMLPELAAIEPPEDEGTPKERIQ